MKITNGLTILMIFDQVSADVLYPFIKNNQMPYLKKYIYDRAAIADKCFTTFPSNTIPGHLAILTGNYCDRHHVHAMKFWNLASMQLRNYSSLGFFNILKEEFNPQIKMIYEFFSHAEAFTALPFAKGATYTYLKTARFVFYYLLQKLNYRVVLIQSAKTFIRHLKNFKPDSLFVLWIPITDVIGHKKGPRSPEYLAHLREIDQMFFKVLFEGYKNWKGLVKMGLFDSTHIIVTADHGSFQVEELADLYQQLSPLPLQIQNKQNSLKILNESDMLLAYTDGIAHVYVRNPTSQDWVTKIAYPQLFSYPTAKGRLNLIELFLKIPSVSHVFVKKPASENASVIIFAKEGSSAITRRLKERSPLLSYQILSGEDPLQYSENQKLQQLMDGHFHPLQDWLPYLSQTNYPMILDQIPRIFSCKTSGDLILMGREGYSFTTNEPKGTHDTGTAICTRVPLLLTGPSIKKGKFPLARTVDIVPTILSLLHKTVDYTQFEGRILSEIIQN
ncbi:MAG: alkaline phosphatase family protein [Candidatus Helarchaeota archaeon]